MRKREESDDEITTQRIEAFSDGVFAIEITLLILEIKIPHTHGSEEPQGLTATLLHLWPSYFVYVLSFVNVGIYWANHHYVFHLYKRTDHVFNLLNVFFLMGISFVPFPTAVLGEYMRDAHEQRAAVVFYMLGQLLPALGWCLMWLYASARFRLIDTRLDPAFVTLVTRQYVLSVGLYALAPAIAFFNPMAGLLLCVGLTLFYLLPPKKPVYINP